MFDGFFDQYSIANGYYDPALDEEDEGALSPKQQRQRRARMIQNPDAAVMPPSLAMGSPPLGLPPMPNNTTPGIVAGAGQPPVIGTPKGPAVMTSPTSAAILPDVIPRREGVTLNDKMRGIYATMGAMGTPTFNSQYADIQDRLLQKDLEDDAFNQKMDLLTLPSYEVSGGNLITKPAQYVKTQDGWKLNPDAAKAEGITAKRLSGYKSDGTPHQSLVTYDELAERGLVDGKTYPEWMAAGLYAGDSNNQRNVRATEAYLKSIGIENADLIAGQVANGQTKLVDLDGCGVRIVDSVGTVLAEIESAEEAQGFKEALSRSDAVGAASGEAAVTDLQKFEQDFTEIADDWGEIQSSVSRGREAISLLTGDDPPKTGFVQGAIAKTFGIGDRQMGKLMGLSGEQLIEALGQTTLLPVSDTDIKKIEAMFANISQDPEYALGILESFINSQERKLVLSRDKFKRRINRLQRNPNVRNASEEADSFIGTYSDIYNFETNEEFLTRTGGK